MSNISLPGLRQLILILAVISIALPTPSYGANAIDENELILSKLDSIINSTPDIIRQKESRINQLRQKYYRAKTDSERMTMSSQLFDEYDVFDSDSALYYAKVAREYVEKLYPESYNLLAEWKLHEAAVYVLQGMFDSTIPLLNSIDPKRLSPEMKAEYYGIRSNAHAMHSLYVKCNDEKKRADLGLANEYRDSIRSVYRALSDQWLWVPIAFAVDSKDKNFKDIDISALQEEVDNQYVASRINAINTYWLSRYYGAIGDESRMIHYMALAACYDASIVNRDIAALEELATYLFEHGQLNRAHNYLQYASNQANLYHNRYRLVSLSDVLPKVRDAYRAEIEKRDERLSLYIRILAISAIVLLASLIFIIVEFRKLKRLKRVASETNLKLQELIKERDRAINNFEKANEELATINSDLSEANKQKIGVLAYALKLTSQYINAMDDYRKKLLRKYKIKRFDELGALLNDPELVKDQYQGFYESFDKTVISIFPDLVEEYNATAGEDGRISPEQIAKNKTLNTKLRIHALKRLGVSKSADIASMLNLSIRTVYNNKTNE